MLCFSAGTIWWWDAPPTARTRTGSALSIRKQSAAHRSTTCGRAWLAARRQVPLGLLSWTWGAPLSELGSSAQCVSTSSSRRPMAVSAIHCPNYLIVGTAQLCNSPIARENVRCWSLYRASLLLVFEFFVCVAKETFEIFKPSGWELSARGNLSCNWCVWWRKERRNFC